MIQQIHSYQGPRIPLPCCFVILNMWFLLDGSRSLLNLQSSHTYSNQQEGGHSKGKYALSVSKLTESCTHHVSLHPTEKQLVIEPHLVSKEALSIVLTLDDFVPTGK